ncbi:helix-turn-helix domain-containing protein [Streptomyces hawaiiensis]
MEAAALFKVSVKAMDNWWAKWRTGGQDALLSRPRGRRVGEHKALPRPSRTQCGRPSSITPPPARGYPVRC